MSQKIFGGGPISAEASADIERINRELRAYGVFPSDAEAPYGIRRDRGRPGGFLSVRGAEIVDEAGAAVHLVGFNVGMDLSGYLDFRNLYSQDELMRRNKSVADPFLNGDDYALMVGWGANLIRMQPSMRFWMLEYAPYAYDDRYLDLLEGMVNDAARYGLRTLLVMNDAGENSAYYSRDLKEGNPLILWTSPDRRARVIALWEHIALRFANNPGIAGYDIMNEPEPPSRDALHAFYQSAIDAIRKHDQKHIIFLDHKHFPIDMAVAWGGTYADPNIALETHYYNDEGDDAFEQIVLGTREYDTREEIQAGVNQRLNHPERQGRPLFVGEFGAFWETGQPGLDWTRNVVEVANASRVHWTYFTYKSQRCTDTANTLDCVGDRTKAVFVPGQRLIINPTDKQWEVYRLNGLPTPTDAQLEALRTRNFVTNSALQGILMRGLRGQ